MRMPIVPGLEYRRNTRHVIYNDNKTRYTWTHLVYLWATGNHLHSKRSDDEWLHCPGVDRAFVDLSHLCHVADCCNWRHLRFEIHPLNMKRNQCKTDGICHGHGDHPDCLINDHTKQCLHDITRNKMAVRSIPD